MHIPELHLMAPSGEAGSSLNGSAADIPRCPGSPLTRGAAEYLAARVERVDQATPHVKVFTLVTDPGRFRAEPGQWVEVAVPCEGELLVGQYSLVSAPNANGRVQLAIKHAERHPATRYLHSRCREGDTAYITCGQGDFVFCPGMADEVVLLGAGIGVAPLLSILRFIRSEELPVAAHLVYSAVSQDEMLFADELGDMSAQPNLNVTCTVTRCSDGWRGHTGRISNSLLESLALPDNALYYFCGARGFINDMRRLVGQRGIPEDRLRYEKW